MQSEGTLDHIKLFESKKIRSIWVEEDQSWYFSIVDVVAALTDSDNPRDYWYRIKQREKISGVELSTICRQFKLEASDGKMRTTDCADTQGLLRIVQSIPSPKAEPFKRWLAQVGHERLEEIVEPELALARMKALYEKKGYPREWIDKRLRGIAVRQDLTDEWQQRGAKSRIEYAILTNEIMQGTFDLKVEEYKTLKNLQRENLRDHMTDIELILTMLAEATTTKLHRDRDSQGMGLLKQDARDGGAVAGRTRKDIEKQSGKPLISNENFKDLASINHKNQNT